MTTRIGDLVHSHRLTGNILQIQARVRDAQADIASGTRAQRWSELADRAGFLAATRQERGLVERLAAENDKVLGRLNTMDATLGSLGELAQRFRTLLVARLGEPGPSTLPLDQEIEQMASELEGLLNRQLDGRYLFAGSRTDAPPVELPEPLPTVADPTLYYKGDAVELAVRADVGVEIAYGVTAAASPFAQLIGALGRAHAAHLANDRAGLEQALDVAAASIEGIAAERARVGVTAARLEGILEGQRGALVRLDELIAGVAETDLAEATTRLARDQAALEASYLVTARLYQTSLAEYLR